MFTYGSDLMNCLSFVCKFATAIINEEELPSYSAQEPKQIRQDKFIELINYLVESLKSIFNDNDELPQEFEGYKQNILSQGKKSSSKLDRLQAVINF